MTVNQAVKLPALTEPELLKLAAELAGQVKPPLVIYLSGPLGAGKTTFARAMIQALGYPGRVKSPTYSLLETYPVNDVVVVHLDLYRINDPGELEYLGLDDNPAATVYLVEWPEKGLAALPPADLIVQLDGAGESRELIFSPQTEKAVTLMESVACSRYPN
jgi:tRNA threonylcarbamoyladenosine biosynthesis protein TsaE